MYTLLRYHSNDKSKWDRLIRNSKNGLFFFQRDFMDYHQNRFLDHSLMFLKGEEPVAVFPATEKNKIITSHDGLTFGSLIITKKIKQIEVIQMFSQIIDYYKSQGMTEIIYKNIPYIFSEYPSQEDIYALYVHQAELFASSVSSVINIKKQIGFNQNKRRLLKKAEKNKVNFVEKNNFSEYWDLLSDVLKKYNSKPTHTLEEICRLKQNFPSNIRLFEARLAGKLLAGTLIFDFGNTVHTQYLAISEEGKKLGALDFVNHHLINDVFSEREYFSLGISTENNGSFLNEGLILQKENMGARAVTLDVYRMKIG